MHVPRQLQVLQRAGLLLALVSTPVFVSAGELSEHRVMIPEGGEMIGYMIAVETNRYCFFAPPMWRVSCKPGGKSLVMMPTDLGTSITVEFITNSPGDVAAAARPKKITSSILDDHPPTNSAFYPRSAALVSSRYPGARIRETFASLTGLGEGIGFDIERKAGNGATLVSRVVYAVQDWGIVEFALTSPAAKFAEWTTTFANTGKSFRPPTR